MKKVLFYAAFVLTMSVFCACSSNLEEEMLDTQSPTESVESTNDEMLSFDSEAEFQEAIDVLNGLTPEEQQLWVKNHYGNFHSLEELYLKALEEAEDLDESEESFNAYKAKYDKYLYFASFLDDCGVYLPVTNKTMALLLNIDGNVRIAGEIRNMKDVDSYLQIQENGDALYSYDLMPTRGNGAYWQPRYISHSTSFGGESSGNIGQEYDSYWWEQSKRRIRLKCGRKGDTVSNYTDFYYGRRMRIHIEISFRKKTWLGWSNYSSSTTTTGTFTGGYNGSINFHKEADSSHDWYHDIPYTVVSGPGDIILYNSAIQANLELSFRGIGQLLYLNFTVPEIQAYAGTGTIQ
ncbi:MAG: hypothetical protein J5506_03245 [Prevotella sp.]|nr:hypothetical protein [Prevotella sp.]